eukprot:gene17460-biopygen2126
MRIAVEPVKQRSHPRSLPGVYVAGTLVTNGGSCKPVTNVGLEGHGPGQTLSDRYAWQDDLLGVGGNALNRDMLPVMTMSVESRLSVSRVRPELLGGLEGDATRGGHRWGEFTGRVMVPSWWSPQGGGPWPSCRQCRAVMSAATIRLKRISLGRRTAESGTAAAHCHAGANGNG